MIVPSLPGCLTFGHMVDESLAMAKEAGEEVPIETDESMIYTVAVEANA